MKKKIRLTILLVCVGCFFVITPVLVAYSMGYRFDFQKMKITATGGIYVRTFPAADQIIIDSKITQKPGMFSNSIFVQSLLPNEHAVLVKKTSYYDYFKTLPVQEKEVTKIENVLLFKKDIQFTIITDKTKSPFITQEKFLIKNNNLYYSDAPENSELTVVQKSTPVLKKIAAFALSPFGGSPVGRQNNNIIWLGTDGFLYKSDLSASPAAEPAKIILTPLKIVKTGSYKIISDSKNIFINNNGNLLFLNTKTNELDDFAGQVKDAKISPDDKNIVYFSGKNLYIFLLSKESDGKVLLYKSPEEITDCIWLNNDYIIISSANKIIISEIDYRGNINVVTLPQTINISQTEKIEVKNPEIFFNQQDAKLYILTGKTLLSSEKLTP